MQNLKQINVAVFKLHGNTPTHTNKQIPSEFYLYRLGTEFIMRIFIIVRENYGKIMPIYEKIVYQKIFALE